MTKPRGRVESIESQTTSVVDRASILCPDSQSSYRARCYQSSLQRFISEYPVGYQGGDTNLYSM